MRIISKVIILFFAQTIIEVIIMAFLAKAGIPFMDFDSTGEDVAELVMSISYYYSFSKNIIIIWPYIALMLLSNKVSNKVSLKQWNLLLSLLLTGSFWLGFKNPINEIVNPILGSLLAGLFILFIINITNPEKAKL